jgi:hypothetical protein
MTKPSKEREFWDWFQQNEEMLLHFDRDQERIFDLLSTALAKVSPNLTYEFGPLKEGARDFVVSAGGIKTAFPAVAALAAAAPVLPRWNIIKFRQRQTPIMCVVFGGKTVKPQDVEFSILSSGTELGVYLFFKGYREAEKATWDEIGYLLLDQGLGEHDVETKVGLIQFFSFGAHSELPRHPLPELPAVFDEKFDELKRKRASHPQ